MEVIIARAEQTAHDERYREQSVTLLQSVGAIITGIGTDSRFVKVGGKLFLPRGIDETNENHEKSVLETLNLQLEREEYYSLRGRRSNTGWLYIKK